MLTTSADILNVVLAGSIFILVIFLCWALYNIIISVQRINRISKIVESGVVKVEEVVEIAREKLRNSSAYFMIIGEIAKKAMEFVKEKREDIKEKKTSKSEKKKKK